MKLTITRFAAVVAAVAVAMLGILGSADAQSTYPPSDPVVRGATFEPSPATANTGIFGFESINPQPSAATADDGTTGGTGGGLAFTGSETDLPLAIGITLLAAGGTAVVAARKREQE